MEPKDINVVLTVYKRNNLDQQVQRILNQRGVNLANVFVYQNESHVDVTPVVEKYNLQHIHFKKTNTKFHGRFTLPLFINSNAPWWAIFDDDTMPNPLWLSYAIDKSKEHNETLIGANGRFYANKKHGLDVNIQQDTPCDIVGHSWVFPKKRIHCMWELPSYTLDNAEDIQFACALWKHYGIRPICPKQDRTNRECHADTQLHLGNDVHASCKKANHRDLRTKTFDYYRDVYGWTSVTDNDQQ